MAKRTMAWEKLSPEELIEELRNRPSVSADELKQIEAIINKFQGDAYIAASQILNTLELSRNAGNKRSASRNYNE